MTEAILVPLAIEKGSLTDKSSINQLDQETKVFIGVVNKVLSGIQAQDKTFEKLNTELHKNPLVQATENQVHRSDSFTKEGDYFQNSSTSEILQDVSKWLTKAIGDDETLDSLKSYTNDLNDVLQLATKIIGEIVAENGEDGFERIVDVGVLKYPQSSGNPLRLYHVEISAEVKKGFGGQPATRGLKIDYQLQPFRLRKEVYDSLRDHVKEKAEEAAYSILQ